METYFVLKKQVYCHGKFSLVPIRYIDRFDIMKWRNEQIYHLRQDKLLTVDDQEYYFTNIIKKLYSQEKPEQLLFSFLKNNNCIGYGGLVHINWVDKNAEISFIMRTELEKDNFENYWKSYLLLIEKIAFVDLALHKIYTFAFDLRPHLYPILEASGFYHEARLKDHCYFEDRFFDVVINSKINKGA